MKTCAPVSSSRRSLSALHLAGAAALLALAQGQAGAANLPIDFSTTYPSNVPVYITFNTTFPLTASYKSISQKKVVSITIVKNGVLSESIPLSDVTDGVVNVGYLNSGVIYASLGAPLCSPKANPPINAAGTAPSASNPSDPAYYYPWQAIAEITYTGNSTDSGDMTAINYFSFPTTVKVITAKNVVAQQAGFTTASSTITATLGKLSADPQITVTAPITNPSSSTYPGQKNTFAKQVVRVLSPNQFGPYVYEKGKVKKDVYPINGFPAFQTYVNTTRGTSTVISGVASGKYTAPPYISSQTPYNFNYNFTSVVTSSGDIVVTGKYTAASGSSTQGVGNSYKITIANDTPTTNPPSYNLSSVLYFCPTLANQTTPSPAKYPSGAIKAQLPVLSGVDVANVTGTVPIHPAVLAQVLHDVCSGYSFGFIGSKTLDPVTKKPFGTEASSTWFKNAPNTLIFRGLQPTNKYYNQYAQIIHDGSNGSVYGFPYSDAISGGVTLNTVTVGSGPELGDAVVGWDVNIGADSSGR